MQILVTFGSQRGGTDEIAQWVGDGLREQGMNVDVLPARQADGLAAYDAVVIGGALYAMSWHRQARRFVRGHAAELRGRPTYFFSSGPLDDSAAQREIRPVRPVQALMTLVGARGHATFGGRLAPDAKGFVASGMAKKMAGDWRDREQVRTWTKTIAVDLANVTLAAP